MRNVWIITKRELGAYFGTPLAYVFVVIFVVTAYATADRPAYAAGGGFAGMQYVVGVSKRYPKHWVGAFLRYDNLSGARFADSPLVRTRNYVAAGVAVVALRIDRLADRGRQCRRRQARLRPPRRRRCAPRRHRDLW